MATIERIQAAPTPPLDFMAYLKDLGVNAEKEPDNISTPALEADDSTTKTDSSGNSPNISDQPSIVWNPHSFDDSDPIIYTPFPETSEIDKSISDSNGFQLSAYALPPKEFVSRADQQLLQGTLQSEPSTSFIELLQGLNKPAPDPPSPASREEPITSKQASARRTNRKRKHNRQSDRTQSSNAGSKAMNEAQQSEPVRSGSKASKSRENALRRNALAARKCREKKREHKEQLEQTAKDLETRNKALFHQYEGLCEQLYTLTNLALTHVGADCDSSGRMSSTLTKLMTPTMIQMQTHLPSSFGKPLGFDAFQSLANTAATGAGDEATSSTAYLPKDSPPATESSGIPSNATSRESSYGF
jgi:hypothetical protein